MAGAPENRYKSRRHPGDLTLFSDPSARASRVMCLGLGVGGSGPSLAAAAALCDQIKIARRFPSRTRPFARSPVATLI